MYFKDIIDKRKIRKVEALDEICTLLATCVGNLTNLENISKQYKEKTNNKIDSDTVNLYINYFIDLFLLSEAFGYDLKGKNIINSTKNIIILIQVYVMLDLILSTKILIKY